MITTILVDLDGVVRHFDPEHVAGVERRHGLELGTLQRAAFTSELLEPAITGQITRGQWTENVGGVVGSPDAAREWMAERGQVDPAMLMLVGRLRKVGLTVAILTNGTDTIPDEMIQLGLNDQFDAIFNSAQIGFAKPDVRAFIAVCESLSVAAGEVFFTDDSPSKLTGAVELGITAAPFSSVDQLHVDLARAGVTY